MPENAWQESRDTGLRHLSVGVALYAGLCSGFILLYAAYVLAMLQAQLCVYGKNGLAVLGIHIFSCRRRHRWFRATCLSRCE